MVMNSIPNARFWTFYHGSPVKLTLAPGEQIRLYEYQRTEEGYSQRSDRFKHCGEYVTNRWVDEGKDCDGVIGSTGVSECRIDRLQSIPIDESFPYFPRDDWHKHQETVCYDQSAEAAGY